jgi:glucose/arabinose dehydrogenase
MACSGCLLVVVCGIALGTACTGSSTPSPPSTGPSAPTQMITGTERLRWGQQADASTPLYSIRYAIYVDGARSELTSASCEVTNSIALAACSSPLPVMVPGAHTLSLASFIVNNTNTVLESAQSSPVQVVVVSGANSVAVARPQSGNIQASSTARSRSVVTTADITTADHVQLRLDVVTEGLEAPTDIAFVPDGRIFIAEHAGRVRVIRNGQLQAAPALTLDDVTTESEGGLLSLALDAAFDRTGFVYALYTTLSRQDAPAFRLARFRAVGDTLGDRAILLDDIEASPHPAAVLRFGIDGKLYAAFDDGGDPAVAGDLSSFNGKILRMNADGSTPDDQAAGTPVYSYAHHSPRGLDWQPATGTLWIVDGDAQSAAQLSAVVAGGDRSKRGVVRATYELPSPVGASALAFYRGGLLPAFRDNLLVAADEGRYLLRIRFDAQNAARIVATERLLQDRVGGVRAVAPGPDGAIYFCTASALMRLTPAPTQ